jgi:hypothetical protein
MMIHRISLSRSARSVRYSVLVLFLGLCIAGTDAARYQQPNQSKKKIELLHESFRHKPIELVEIRDKTGKPLTLSKAFKADDEWPKGLEFKVKNVFTKDIICIMIYLDFPETTATGNMMAFPVYFGKIPLTSEVEDVPVLKPGEEATIKVDEQTYSQLKRFLETRHPVASLTRLGINLHSVYFSDHTGWLAGDYLVQDPADPRHFINVGESLPNQ